MNTCGAAIVFVGRFLILNVIFYIHTKKYYVAIKRIRDYLDTWVSLVAQTVKNLPVKWEIQV